MTSSTETPQKPAKSTDGREGHPEADVDKKTDPHTEKQLDKGLKETFPASDPVSINPGAD